jgi:hypothetical protein
MTDFGYALTYPRPVGNLNGHAGFSGYPSREDHEHALDPTLLDFLSSSTDTNLIDNPEFRHYQRALPITGSSIFGFDRWALYNNGAAAWTHAVGTSWPNASALTSALYTVSTADAALAATDYSFLNQQLEGNILAATLWGTTAAKSLTISFWAKASLGGTYCLGVRNGAVTRSYISEFQLSSNVWTKITVIIPPETTGVWSYNNASCGGISWSLACRTTFQGTNNTWNAGNFLATSNQTNLSANIGNTFSITQVQAIVGTYDPPFKSKNHIDDLNRCKRYFQLFSVVAGAQMISGPGQCLSGVTAIIHVPFQIPFRAAPVFTNLTAAGTYGVWNAASALINATALVAFQSDPRMATINVTVAAGLVAGDSTYLLSSVGNAASFQYSAEI